MYLDSWKALSYTFRLILEVLAIKIVVWDAFNFLSYNQITIFAVAITVIHLMMKCWLVLDDFSTNQFEFRQVVVRP